MLKDAKYGKIDRVITKSISRFARNTQDSLSAVRQLKEYGVSVFFEKENIDTATLNGEVLLTVFSSFAQEESMSISRNLKQSVRMRMQNGSYVPSHVPYGYKLNDNKLEISPNEHEVVVRIFNQYLAGDGQVVIAKSLTADGIPTPTGKETWATSTICGILCNEKYKGDSMFQKTYTPDMLPLKDIKNKGDMPKFYVKNSHEPLVSAEIFDRVQQLLAKNEKREFSVNESVFRRKVFCKNCGTVFRRITRNQQVYWACRLHHHENRCPVKAISQQELADKFVDLFDKLKANSKFILIPLLDSLNQLKEQMYQSNSQLEQINKQLLELSTQAHTLTELMNQGVLDASVFRAERDDLSSQVRKLKNDKQLILSDHDDEEIELTEQLIDFLDSTDYLIHFDEKIFERVIEKIEVCSKRQLHFVLTNGVVLTEYLKPTRRECVCENTHLDTK